MERRKDTALLEMVGVQGIFKQNVPTQPQRINKHFREAPDQLQNGDQKLAS